MLISYWLFDNLNLNSSMLLELITCAGKLFQILIVEGKKECKKVSMWDGIVLSRCVCPLVLLVFGVVYLSADIATKLFKILYNIITFDDHLLCSSVGHPSCCSIDVTLEVYEYS